MEIKNSQITIVGPGRVGTHIASLVRKAGWSIQSIIGRTQASIAHIKHEIGNVNLETFDLVAGYRDILLLTVSDSVIAPVCDVLAEKGLIHSNTVIIHTSGASNSRVLEAAIDRQASVASLHPLQTFPSRLAPFADLAGTYWFFEGGHRARDVASHIVNSLGGYFHVLKPEQKVAYHLSATIACNSMNAILEASLRCSDLAGIHRDEMQRAIRPLMQSTLDSMLLDSPTASLTGPVSRGDLATVESHVTELSRLPEVRDIYMPLANFLLEMADNSGRVDSDTYKKFSDFFNEFLVASRKNMLENQ